ncbi:MAG TPA: energy transducer TonB [Bacteroidales bacterium]|nr:energy transducer TonB [Bacteroidales bacterium]
MRRYEGKIAGIIGTIIIHLIGAVIFMSVKLTSLYQEDYTEFLVEFEPERDFVEEELIDAPVTLEELFENDDRFRDIVRNIATQPEAQIDVEDYIDRVKEEMIAAGQLGEDNFIDQQKNALNEMGAGDTALEFEREISDDEVSANELAAQYQGPTRIYYDLAGRYHVELPIPIYKCEGSGIAVVNIEVNQRGRITDAKIDPLSSSTNDPCLFEAAIGAINRTRFNPDYNAAPRQSGTITYHFVAQ